MLRILCATDFSDTSTDALRLTLALAAKQGAAVTLLHVIEQFPDVKATYGSMGDTDPSSRELERSAVERLRTIIDDTGTQGVRIEPRAVIGRAYKEILTASAAEPTDLIVIGAQGHGALEHFLFGSNAQHIVRAATCPVLTARPLQHARPVSRDEAAAPHLGPTASGS